MTTPKPKTSLRQASQLALGALLLLAPALALAGPWDTMGTQILGIFTNGLTRTIAIIAVIALGIAALVGKLSWDWAVKVIIGITLIFGGVTIVDYLIAAVS